GAASEREALEELRGIARKNKVARSFIGAGYSDTITPPVIQRNILENPGWYTAYTPYQAEIAQGRLEALLNFQTMITDLTGFDIANASLLDEATAAAEAMALCAAAKGGKPESGAFFVSEKCHPQTIEVVRTRARSLGIKVVVGDHRLFDFETAEASGSRADGKEPELGAKFFGALVQYPATDGVIYDYGEFVTRAHATGALVVVAADLLALTLLRPPGEFDADVAIGSTQRFGVPLGFGGPHAAYFATRDAYKRHMPGRLVGVSHDAAGRPAYRLALQTREQHIRRDKATSNICTAQVLLAVIASMYAVYHGPRGLLAIAEAIHEKARLLAAGLHRLGHPPISDSFFDTVCVHARADGRNLFRSAEKRGLNFRVPEPRFVCIALDETTTDADIQEIFASVVDAYPALGPTPAIEELRSELAGETESFERRASEYLTHPVFNTHRTETEMLRYLRRLESRDLSLTTSMIPLGSCTMKLNATAEMFPLSWPEFANLHPFAPENQSQGYRQMATQLEEWLAEITGFAAVSLQPNAGSQGEYAGLLAIREYHAARNEAHRDICLIPQSAHGTNPASAVMAGFRVVPVVCLKHGDIDLADLRAKADTYGRNLAALMVTYPSTHGVFETTIREVCEIVHQQGGQVYMDGANMNAQVGLCRP
ncbi:MAG: aminomethyl-transferring glycine dehydrogenase, partial [Chthoniobacterales bacterium]